MNEFKIIPEIIETFPGYATDTLLCQNCFHTNGKIKILGSQHSQYNWCQLLVCSKCSKHWYLCTFCILSKQLASSNLRYHHQKFHNLSVISTIPPINESSSLQSLSSSENDFISHDIFHDYHHPIHKYNINTNLLLNSSNITDQITTTLPITDLPDTLKNFSTWQQQKLSLEYLTGYTNFNQMDNYHSIDSYDAQYNLKFFEFVTSLTQPLQEDFCDLIEGMRPYMLNSFQPHLPSNLPILSEQNSSKKHIILPHTYNDLRRIHLRGKKSMMELIPQIPVLSIGKGSELHSYVSLKKCIQHFILFGGFGLSHIETEVPCTVSSIFASKRCLDIGREGTENISSTMYNVNILPFVMFSDDFDPSASLVKANRRGIWVYSCTFKNQLHSDKEIASTYVLAIGNKGSNHLPVLSRIEREINEVRCGNISMFYQGTLNLHIQPIAIPLLRHGDQPERRSINMLKLGKETNHARWRHSLNISLVKDKLPSCCLCSTIISNHLKHNSNCYDHDHDILAKECGMCSNWSFDSKYEFLHTPPPIDFPIDEIPADGKLRPIVLNKTILKNAIQKTHHNVSTGHWSSSNGKAFLTYFCLNTATVNYILDIANNCNNLRIANESEVRDVNLNFIVNDSQKYPSKYTQSIPSHIVLESLDDLDTFPDTPMHLISGFVKAIVSQVVLFLKRKSSYYRYFKMISQDTTINCLHSMKLSWLKVLPFSSEKFAGYACENYIHLTFLFKFICFSLLNLKITQQTTFPKSPQSNWTSDINRKWLSLRGLNTKGNAKSLRERVREYMEKEEIVEVEKIHLLEVSHIIRMLISCNNCIHLLLSDEISDKIINRTHLCLIRALNDINFVDKLLRANQRNPIWYVKYNLLSLLNCIENMKNFGPTKDRWEGSMEGEKCIQYLKKYFTGYTKKYQIHLHKKYNLKQSIQNLKRMNNISSRKLVVKGSKQYVTYKNIIEITSCIMRHRPLSLVKFKFPFQANHSTMGFITKKNKVYHLNECFFVKTENFVELFKLQNFSALDDFDTYDLIEENIEDYLIGIPYIVKSMDDRKLYYFVSKKGKELKYDYNLHFTNY